MISKFNINYAVVTQGDRLTGRREGDLGKKETGVLNATAVRGSDALSKPKEATRFRRRIQKRDQKQQRRGK